MSLTIGPEVRASRPRTTFSLVPRCNPDKSVAKAAVYLTRSTGVSPAPGLPPMVPLIPEIDLINVMGYFQAKVTEFPLITLHR